MKKFWQLFICRFFEIRQFAKFYWSPINPGIRYVSFYLSLSLSLSSATDIIDQLEEQFKREKNLAETSHQINIPLPPAPPTLPPPLIMQSGFPPMVPPPPIMPLPPQVAPPTSQDWIPSHLPPPPPTSQSSSSHG